MENNTVRTVLAVALCLGILVGWHYLFPSAPPAPVSQSPQVETQQTAGAASQAAGTAPQAQPPAAAAPQAVAMAKAEPLAGTPITINTPLYSATLLSSGGVLQKFALNRFRLTLAPDSPRMGLVSPEAAAKAPMGLYVDGRPTWRDATWTTDAKDATLSQGDSVTLTFTGKLGDLTIKRELTFSADTYVIAERVTILSPTAQVSRVGFTLAATGLSGGEEKYNATRAAYFAEKSLESADVDKLKEGKTIAAGRWAAVESNYFISALIPGSEAALTLLRQDDVTRIAVEKSVSLAAGQPSQVENTYFMGPKTRIDLAAAPGNLQAALNYGFFGPLAEICLWILHFLYRFVGNYGVAIILLTVLIKALFWPLSQKSYRSMEKMRKLQPMMAAIREKYPDNREQMNKELMQLYKTYKVNPAGGCLPMLVQLPVFFGLYQALLNAIELRHAPFIAHLPFTSIPWLADLSSKDPFYITPIIMGVTMFLQQKMSPAPGDPTQAKIMMFMPVIFTIFFLGFPSGLVVYWLVNNLLSIAQQGLLRKQNAAAATKG